MTALRIAASRRVEITRLVAALALAWFAFAAPLHAQTVALQAIGQATLAVTTSTANVALPNGATTMLLTNNGSNDLRFALGATSAVTASATTSFLLKAGTSATYAANNAAYIAAIGIGGSTSLEITQGNGQPSLGGGGGSGSGGGAATIANGADVAEGSTTDAPATVPTTSSAATVVALLKALANVANAPYPTGAVPITASATGTTAATTATLAGTSGKTTYICGYSIRANATANTNVTDTITGVITGTLSSILWVPANTAGLGVDEQIFSPCIPASAANTAIAIVSGAPGTGGLVSAKGWGYQL